MGNRARAAGESARDAASRSASTRATSTAIRTSSPAASGSGSALRGRWRCNPRFMVLDEPISALDVSIQSQIINLLTDLQEQVRADVPVHLARPVGGGVHLRPRGGDVPGRDRGDGHERRAVPAVRCIPTRTRCSRRFPTMDPAKKRQRIVLQGDVPSPINPPAGCRFHPRCPLATEACCVGTPPLVEIDGHQVRCHAVERYGS